LCFALQQTAVVQYTTASAWQCKREQSKFTRFAGLLLNVRQKSEKVQKVRTAEITHGKRYFSYRKAYSLCFQHSVIHSVSMRSLARLCRSLPVVVLAGAYALRAFATLESRTITKLFYTCAYRLQSVSSDRAPSRYYIVAPVTSYEQSIWPAKLVR